MEDAQIECQHCKNETDKNYPCPNHARLMDELAWHGESKIILKTKSPEPKARSSEEAEPKNNLSIRCP